MIEIISGIVVLLSAALAAYEHHRRNELEKKMQADSDLLNSDPAEWMRKHFPRKAKGADAGKAND